MTYNHKDSQFPKTVYLRVLINGRMDLIPMEVNSQGLLKYINKYTTESESKVDAKSSVLNGSDVREDDVIFKEMK